MDPFAILSGIYSAAQALRAAAAQVKANKKLARRLAERVDALLPELHALEQRQRSNMVHTGVGGVSQQPNAHMHSALNSQLEALLLCLTEAVALVTTFSEATWVRRVISKGDYADEFAAIGSRIATAQADLGFGVAVDALIVAEQDAEDAKADLEAIRQMIPILMAAVQQAEANAERRHLSAAERQNQQIEMQQQQAQRLADMHKQMEAHLARAELRSQKARQAAEMAAAVPIIATAADPVSPAVASTVPAPAPSPSSRSSRRHELLHIPLGDLRLEPKPVGSGGFGDVFRAQWTTRHMTVAVKKLRVEEMTAADIAEFDREAAVLHALPYHAHVLQLHGVAVDEAVGTYLMIVEWMEGGSLHRLLKASRSDPASLPLSRRLQLCIECALGVNHLHQMQPPVVHRDIKSLNFLLDKHGQVKVGDFGMARMRSATATHSTAAQATGTLCWMPPEFLNGDESGTRATTFSDVYSLGVVCWEILTGQEPFAGQSAGQIVFAIVSGKQLPIPAHLPAELTQLLRACWVMDPSQRPSCSDVIKTLALLQDDPALAPVIEVAAAPSPSGSFGSAAASAAATTPFSTTVSIDVSCASPSSATSLSTTSLTSDTGSVDPLSSPSSHSKLWNTDSRTALSTPLRGPAQLRLLRRTAAAQVHCLQSCTRLALCVWIDGRSEQLVTELNGVVVPPGGMDLTFPVSKAPHTLLLLGDQQRLLASSSVHGVLVFSFTVDAAGGNVSWALCSRQKLTGAVGLAYHAASSSVLTVGKGLLYGCNLFALPLDLTTGRFDQPTKVPDSGWVNLDCRIAVDNQRQLLAVADPRSRVLIHTIVGADPSSLSIHALAQLPVSRSTGVCFDQHGAALLATTDQRALIFGIHADAVNVNRWDFAFPIFQRPAPVHSACVDGGVVTVVSHQPGEVRVFALPPPPGHSSGGLVPSQLKLSSTSPEDGVQCVQSSAHLQLRVWVAVVDGKRGVVVEHRGRIQPVELFQSAYPQHDGGQEPWSALLLDRLALLLVADSNHGVLLFHLTIDDNAVSWTLIGRQLMDSCSLAFHAPSSSVFALSSRGKLHVLQLQLPEVELASRTVGQGAVLEAPQQLVSHPPIEAFSSIAVDSRANLLAVTNSKSGLVDIYSLTDSGDLVSDIPLVSVPYSGGSSGSVCFDPDGSHCILAVCQRAGLELIQLRPTAPAIQSVRLLSEFGFPGHVCISDGELTVTDGERNEIHLYHSRAMLPEFGAIGSRSELRAVTAGRR